MKKLLSIILSILIFCSAFISTDIFSVFTVAESNVIDLNNTDIYPQQLYVAEQYSENFDNIFVGTDSSSYARTYYNSMLNDDAFITGIVAWETIHIATSPSYSLESGMVTKTDFYRTALFDYLTVQVESGSTGEYFESVYKQVKNQYTSFIISSTKEIMGKEKNISANELKTLKLTEDRKQLLLNGTKWGEYAATASDVMKILEWAKNFYDAVELVAKYCALTDLHDGTKEVLSYIANDSTNPLDLRIAAQDCAECMGDSYQEILEAMLNGSYSVLFDVLGDYMDLGWNKLMTKIPGANIVFLGAKGIRAIANLFDSKDEKVKAYYQIEASVKCEDAILKAMSAYRTQFDSNNTQENAVLYLKAVEMYKSAVLLGYDYSVDLLNIVNNSTSALIFNQTEDCTALINDIKTFKLNKQSYYERFDTATINSYKTTYFPDYDQLEASANTTYVCPFSYTVNNATVTITKYNGSATTVRIPELINNYPVTAIGDKAFYNCKSLVSVTLPDTISSIGKFAFYNCEKLEGINIPQGLTSIDNYAFSYCEKIESIILPNSITIIGTSAFANCYSLLYINIPENISTISNGMFSGCKALKNISIPESVTAIGSSAFSNCASITKISIPNNVTCINGNAFSGCKNLIDVSISERVTNIGTGVFSGCEALEYIQIPDNIKIISGSMFKNCVNLKNVDMADDVTSVGDEAFYGCVSMTDLNLPNSVTHIGSMAYLGCTGLVNIILPDKLVTISQSAFTNCSSLKEIALPKNVKTISNYAFYGCTSLEKVTLNENLENIWEAVFTKCGKITSIYIPKSVTRIEGGVFAECYSLTEINVDPENANYTSIDGVLFTESKETLVDFPAGRSGVYEVPDGVVWISDPLRGYDLDGSPLLGAFYNCKNITEIILPESVKYISAYSFYGCDSLEKINLSDSILGIYGGAFQYCVSLKEIRLPDSVKSIYNTFYSCENLETVSFSENVTSINSKYAFFNCDNVTFLCPYNSYADTFAQTNGFNRVIFGDYNQDYIVNASDMSVMRKYLIVSIESEQPDMVISDCNRDGVFDIRDLVRLKKQSATA